MWSTKTTATNKDCNVSGNNRHITHSTTSLLLGDHVYSSRKMCYYRLFIFATCGHRIWGPLVASCPSKSSSDATPTAQTFSSSTSTTEPCPGHKSHPLHTRKIESLCAPCAKERERLMSSLDSPLIEIEDLNWELLVEEPPKTSSAQAVTLLREKMKEAKLLERGRIE